MARARAHIPEHLASMLRSDWEKVITEANLGLDDTKIAKMYLLDAVPQIDIAFELDIDRSTISRRLPKILTAVDRTARKLNIL